MTRLSRGLEEIAGFVESWDTVLRPEELDLVKVARESIAEVNDDPAADRVTVKTGWGERHCGEAGSPARHSLVLRPFANRARAGFRGANPPPSR